MSLHLLRRGGVFPACLVFTIALFALPYGSHAAAPDKPVEPPAKTTNAKDGATMVLIPAGEFLMGTSEAQLAAWLAAHPEDTRKMFVAELPQKAVHLDAYYIYVTEVTVAQFRRYTEATGYAFEWDKRKPAWGWVDEHPMVHVRWDEANAYAQWAGAALPTEAQWEKAARGGDGRLFPWGDAWPPPAKAGNFADEAMKRKYPTWTAIEGYDDGHAEVAPVGSYPANPYGVHDLAGNVWEWCADWFESGYYRKAPARNPTGPETGTARVIRGGSWGYVDAGDFRCANRFSRNLGAIAKHFNYLGFRCVAPVPAAE